MIVIGIDEVGRGAWAGPLLVVAARQTSELPAGLKDSKRLSKKHRENLKKDVELSCDIGEGWVGSMEIDTLGLSKAMRLAVARALQAIQAGVDEEIIMDGSVNYCDPRFTNVICIVRGDNLHPIVSAASIYAKVARDQVMAKYAEVLPRYGFDKHVGYGTAQHIAALNEYGVSELHRLSYKPVRSVVDAN